MSVDRDFAQERQVNQPDLVVDVYVAVIINIPLLEIMSVGRVASHQPLAFLELGKAVMVRVFEEVLEGLLLV